MITAILLIAASILIIAAPIVFIIFNRKDICLLIIDHLDHKDVIEVSDRAGQKVYDRKMKGENDEPQDS